MLSQAIKRLVQKFNSKFFANKALQLAGKSEIRIRSLVSRSYTPEGLFRRMKKARGLSTLGVWCGSVVSIWVVSVSQSQWRPVVWVG